MDKISLFWKKMFRRTIIHKEAKSVPAFMDFKDKITVGIRDNVADGKLKIFCYSTQVRTSRPSSIFIIIHYWCIHEQ
jgi:hypothetical protein